MRQLLGVFHLSIPLVAELLTIQLGNRQGELPLDNEWGADPSALLANLQHASLRLSCAERLQKSLATLQVPLISDNDESACWLQKQGKSQCTRDNPEAGAEELLACCSSLPARS